ncbi:pentatricopeptide repeat-containing protein At2g20540-like [Musa acuminata AAA Group]|uniref:pentatricopeptide repeat-containing protein At2g20540-like n=1 Tax=Musa acuminata AAA Group TaxID=214697 RepID=UPI0031D07EFD
MALHGHVLKLGLGADIYIATSLMDLYRMCSQALDARKVFDHMPDKDIVAWNVMLSSYARLGMMRLAEQLFEEIPLRNVNSWTALICGFLECGDLSESMIAFHRMQLHGLKPDKVMVVTMLSAIADLGMLDSGPC